MPYRDALAVQRELHAAVVAGDEPDTVLLREHDSVYTAGCRTTEDERPRDPTVAVIDVNRGSKITWPGHGQLVDYPDLRLTEPVDVEAYVRRVERLMIDAWVGLRLTAIRVDGRSGAWTVDGRRKIGAVAIRICQGVTMHGFAVNADPVLSAYDSIVARGIRDATVASITAATGRKVSVDAVRAAVDGHFDALMGAPG